MEQGGRAAGKAGTGQTVSGAVPVPLDDVPVPLLLLDGDGVVVAANGAATALLDLGPLAGRRFVELLETGEGDPRALSGREACLRTREGRERWFAVHCTSDGARRVAALIDVTEERARCLDLHGKLAVLEETMRARSRFFAQASHDLRQPLQALALFTSALETQVESPRALGILQSIKLSLSTMEEMFESLLDISRLNADALTVRPEVFVVNDIIEQLETEFRPQAERKGLELRVVPSSASICSDPAHLARILRNFLSNAVRYTRSGRILLGCRRDGANLKILVGDTGPGIDEDHQARIFEEFYQADRSVSASGGLGLGLAIVKRLAQLLGHPLGVASRPGKGAIFSVSVPVEEGVDAEDEDGLLDFADLHGMVVAVIDEESEVRHGLCLLFEYWGCVVAQGEDAASVAGALGALNATPDIVIADLRLDGGARAGLSAVEALLRLVGREVPVILLSGDAAADACDCASGRHYEVFRKPVDPVKLRLALTEAAKR